MTGERFHNPYHFVPVRPRPEGELRPGEVPAGELRAAEHLRHDRWAEGTRSGRIVCRLSNETEIFLGDRRLPREGDTAEVTPFLFDGKPAIPGSSLRGLISAVAEAASDSAARVLGDEELSYRKRMKRRENQGGPLSAIGMIVEEEGSLKLRPLTVPVLTRPDARGRSAAVLPRRYRGIFPIPNLKVYFGSPERFQDPDRLPQTTTWKDLEAGRFAYLALARSQPRTWHDDSVACMVAYDDELQTIGKFVVGQKTAPEGDVTFAPEPGLTRGLLRVLGRWDRDIGPRKREIFIPFPEEIEKAKLLPIQPAAIQRFDGLADERHEATQKQADPLPYALHGSRPARRRQSLRLERGDLVFFRPTPDGQAVAELAISSIWRGRVEWLDGHPATARDFFRATDAESVPFTKGRRLLTVAEQIFGFVAQEDVAERQAQALAGRVRFSSARTFSPEPAGGWFHEAAALKILASPKPPSPALYFRPKEGGGYIEKAELSPTRHRPQGRKFYLHHHVEPGKRPWEAVPGEKGEVEGEQMRSRVGVLRRDTELWFHVDFDNLTDHELGLLLYALRPTEVFRHKLGMGKPLGLGTVRIDPMALLIVDRRQRYTASGFGGGRYHTAWKGTATLPDVYAEEESSAGALQGSGGLEPDALRKTFRDAMEATTRRALELLGETVSATVSYPVVEGQTTGAEGETYKWFVANEQGSGTKPNIARAAKTCLTPLTGESEAIAPLDKLQWRGD